MNYFVNHSASVAVSLILLPVFALVTYIAWIVGPVILCIVVPAVVESVVS